MDFFSNKNSAAKKPVIRKEVVQVPAKKLVSNSASASPSPLPAARRAGPPKDRFQLSGTNGLKSRPTAPSKPLKSTAQRALAPSRGVKRKSATPQPQGPMFSDDEGDDSSDIAASDSDASRKRMKSSVSSIEDIGPRRTLASETVSRDGSPLSFIHASELTSGDQASKFVNPWDGQQTIVVRLKYPSRSNSERFELKWPKGETDDYKPMEDLKETVQQICTHYLSDEDMKRMCDDENKDSFERRFNRAWQRQSVEEYVETVKKFNRMLKPLIDEGKVHRELSRQSSMDLEWVKRILDQTYARTVSPRVELLRAYKNGSDNVYGELLPRFVSEVFRETRLNHEQIFVDLGSGVGNVVLQAALEVGCESWGIEMMPNPCDLAELQAKEFPARAKLWGLNVGAVHLLRGDFTENREIGSVLQKADVVLVNNQAFTPELNDRLMSMFLDLKEGCQVVSLRPFVPEGHKIAIRNVDSACNMFVQRRREYFSNSVSWTDRGGFYYYATKDSGPLRAFKRKHGLR